ncbi:MAG: hypothetical protein ACI9HK_003437 [Pirellulaceae bacterium]|jgi:hypothetical protein
MPLMPTLRFATACFGRLLFVLCILTATNVSAAPKINSISLRGLLAGGATSIVIDGTDLLPAPRILLPFPVTSQEIKSGATPTRIEVQLTLPPDVTHGIYLLRLVNEKGVSNAVGIAVDHLPQLPFSDEIASLPVSLHGNLTGAQLAKTSFTGKAGQQILVAVEGRRLGSMLRPVLRLYNDRGLQLYWSQPSRLLGGDVRLSAKLPADGRYTVELHDTEFAGPQPGFFRMKIGSWQFADLPFPPAVERGKTVQLGMIGNSSSKSTAFNAPSKAGQYPTPWLDPSTASGARPIVLVSATPEFVETATAPDSLQALPLPPVAVSGRLQKKGETDHYTLAVQPGTKLRFAAFAERLGSSIDGVLEVKNPAGGVLVRGDDAQDTSDPEIDFTVPADVNSVVLEFKDLLGRGSEDAIYRIAVTNVDDTSERPDFDLEIAQGTINIPRGGATVVVVHADRKSYKGPIQLQFANLPTGVTAVGTEIPVGASGGLITLRSNGDAVGMALTSLRSAAGDDKFVRSALVSDAPLGDVLPWCRSELAIAVQKPGEVQLSVLPIEIANDSALVMGGKLSLPTRLTRSTADGGPVRLSIMTSQVVPMNNGQPDQNKAIRLAANVEVPVDEKAKQAAAVLAAAEKALTDAQASDKSDPEVIKKATEARDLAAQALTAAELSAKNAAELSVIVPPDLAAAPYYELAIHAELLSANKQTVLAEFYSLPLRLKRLNPISVELPAEKLNEKLDGKTERIVKLTGKILRRGGLEGDIEVQLEGLPSGSSAAKVTVKADQTEFSLDVKFPANFQPGTHENIRVFATGKLGNQAIRSDNAVVTIELEAPDA